MKSDLVICIYDGLPCDRAVISLGFGACYVKDLDGKLLSVCCRFKVNPRITPIEHLVHKDLIPK